MQVIWKSCGPRGLVLWCLLLLKVFSLDVDVDEYDFVTSLMDKDDSEIEVVSESCSTSLSQSTFSSVAATAVTGSAAVIEEESAVPQVETAFTSERSKKEPQSKIVVSDHIAYPYEESLLLRPLPNNHLLASFVFNMQSEPFSPMGSGSDSTLYNHYRVFPRAIKPLLERTSTRQLNLRFTRGFWDSEAWGPLPYDGTKSGGSGVELWAVLEASSKDEAYAQWKSLANLLSGLFCASINFIDLSKTSYPVHSFHPDNKDGIPLFNSQENTGLYLLHAAVANEPICTENLTPLIKLLPTKGKSGISSYLDGHKVFDSIWHSLSIDVETKCDDFNGECHFDMEAIVSMALHVPTALARVQHPIPKPLKGEELKCDTTKHYDAYQCFPASPSTEADFLLSQLFNRTITGCDHFAIQPSLICTDVTNDWDISLKVNDSLLGTDDNCFHLDNTDQYDISLKSHNTKSVSVVGEVPVYVSRALTGYGQDHGGLRTVFQNPTDKSVKISYFESLPWFMRVYLSSLAVESNNDAITVDKIMETMNYIPAMDRKRPTVLEFVVEIPAYTTFSIAYQFDKTLLQFAEYPPDANHGFEVEAGVVTVLEPAQYQIRTSTLLLYLSTPDFSMPYNVIIISSTVMGLIFGVMFNLIVKKVVTLEYAEEVLRQRSIKNKLLMLKGRILSKLGLNKV